eukprot:scaffold5166_cov100-Isochrysis_galbana.AAC.6
MAASRAHSSSGPVAPSLSTSSTSASHPPAARPLASPPRPAPSPAVPPHAAYAPARPSAAGDASSEPAQGEAATPAFCRRLGETCAEGLRSDDKGNAAACRAGDVTGEAASEERVVPRREAAEPGRFWAERERYSLLLSMSRSPLA